MTTNDLDVEVLVCLFLKDKFQPFMISFPKNRFSLVPSVGLVEAGGGGVKVRSSLNHLGHSSVQQIHLPQLFVGEKCVSPRLEA